jgi:hypothetical protein
MTLQKAHARCVVCWVTNATDARSGYIIHFAFSKQQWQGKCVSVLPLYTHVRCLLCNSTLISTPDHISETFSSLTSLGFPVSSWFSFASWFPCVYKRMLRWFPSFQVATTCLSCSPPDFNFLVTFFSFHICVHVK